MNAAPRPHIVSHTALRGIAALIVVGYHLRFGADDLLAAEEATRLFERGYLWVDLFFILSGFVLCYVYEPKGLPTISHVSRFYRARLARVWPLHALTLAVLVTFSLATIYYARMTASPGSAYESDWSALLGNILLVHAWGIFSQSSWNIPAWSISAEVFAYLWFPAFLLMFRNNSMVFALIAISFSLCFYTWIGTTTGDLDITVGVALLRCLAGFVLGMAIYRIADGVDAKLPEPLISAGQLTCVGSALVVIEAVPNDTVIIVPFVGLVLLTARDRGVLGRVLSAGWLQRLGEWSYAVYLLHVPLILIGGFAFARIARAAGLDGMDGLRWFWIAMVYAAVIPLSALTYERFEKPARSYLLGRTASRKVRPVPAP